MSRAAAVRGALRSMVVVFLASSFLMVYASGAEAGLVFRRANGTAIPFSGTPRAWCGPWEEGVARPSVHVVLEGAKRRWQLSAVRRDVKVGRPLEFPNEFVFNRPRGARLFVADASNEASTAEEESSGSMVFSSLSCGLGDVVAFRIHAALGSELSDRKPVRVSGNYRGSVSTPPPTPAS